MRKSEAKAAESQQKTTLTSERQQVFIQQGAWCRGAAVARQPPQLHGRSPRYGTSMLRVHVQIDQNVRVVCGAGAWQWRSSEKLRFLYS